MIFLGADHGGFGLKEEIKKYLSDSNYQFEDLGNSFLNEQDDFTDFAVLVAEKVVSVNEKGILICGTGIGMSIAANKVKGAKAALCCNEYMAKQARAHNDANILCLGGRVLQKEEAQKIVLQFLKTEFEGAERLIRRNNKIKQLE